MRLIRTIVAIVLVFGAMATANAATLYVRLLGGTAVQCNGQVDVDYIAGPGTNSPNCALNKVSLAGNVVTRGSTVWVHGGGYANDSINTQVAPVNESDRITFNCTDDGITACGDTGCATPCLIASTGTQNPISLTTPSRSYITIDGFSTSGGVVYGGSFTSQHNILRNLNIRDFTNNFGVLFIVDGSDQLAENVVITRSPTKISSPSIDGFAMGQCFNSSLIDCGGRAGHMSNRITFRNVSVHGGRNGGHIEYCTDCVYDGGQMEDIYNHVLSIGENDAAQRSGAECGGAASVINLTIKNVKFYATSDFGEPIPDVRSVSGFTFINNVTNNLQLPDANTPHCIDGAIVVRNNAFVNYSTSASNGVHLGLNANQTSGRTAPVFDIDYNAYIGDTRTSDGLVNGNIQGFSVPYWVDTRSGTFSAYPDPDSDGGYLTNVGTRNDIFDWRAHGTNPDATGFDAHSIVVANLDWRYNANVVGSGKMGQSVWAKTAPTGAFITECSYPYPTYNNVIDTRSVWADVVAGGGFVELNEDTVVRGIQGFASGRSVTNVPACGTPPSCGDCNSQVNFVPAFTTSTQVPPDYTDANQRHFWWKAWGLQDPNGDGLANFSLQTDVFTTANRDGWILQPNSSLIDGGDPLLCGHTVRGASCDIGPNETNQGTNPLLTVSPTAQTVIEGTVPTPTIIFASVQLSSPPSSNVTFDWIINGSGANPAGIGTTCSSSGTIDVLPPFLTTTRTETLSPTVYSVALSMGICDDLDVESNETFTFTIFNVTGPATLSGTGIFTVTITDPNEVTPPTLSINSPTQSEGFIPAGYTTPNMLFTVTTSKTIGTDITFSYVTSGATATMGGSCGGTADGIFTSSSATIPANQTSVTFAIPICDDALVESSEYFSVALTSSLTTNSPAQGTILDNDSSGLPAVSINDALVSEGDGTVTVTVIMNKTDLVQVTMARATGDTDADGTIDSGEAVGGAACTNGIDYITPTVGPLLGINAGQTTAALNIVICDDTYVEGSSETFRVTLSSLSVNAVFTDSYAIVTINDNDFAQPAGGALISGATLYGINPVVGGGGGGPPPPPALSLCGAAPDYGVSAPVLAGGTGACTGTPTSGTRCYTGGITGCDDGNGSTMPTLTYELRLTQKDVACGGTQKGTIITSPGLGNSSFSTDSSVAGDIYTPTNGVMVSTPLGNGTQDFRDAIIALTQFPNCYRVIETRYGPTGGQGWHDTGEPGVLVGVMRALARPASLHRYLKEQFSVTGQAFCGFGSSGGAAQLASDLAAYSEGDVFNMIMIGSGPWNSRMDLGCTATTASTFLGDGYPDPGSTFIDISNGYASTTGPCYNAPTCYDLDADGTVNPAADCVSLHYNDSLLGPSGKTFTFPNTKIVMIRGLNDLSSGAPVQAERFWQKVADATYGGTSGPLLPAIVDYPSAPHDVASNSVVDAAIVTALVGGCGGGSGGGGTFTEQTIGWTYDIHAITRGHNRKVIYNPANNTNYIFWLRDQSNDGTLNGEAAYSYSSDGVAWNTDPAPLDIAAGGGFTAFDGYYWNNRIYTIQRSDYPNTTSTDPHKYVLQPYNVGPSGSLTKDITYTLYLHGANPAVDNHFYGSVLRDSTGFVWVSAMVGDPAQFPTTSHIEVIRTTSSGALTRWGDSPGCSAATPSTTACNAEWATITNGSVTYGAGETGSRLLDLGDTDADGTNTIALIAYNKAAGSVLSSTAQILISLNSTHGEGNVGTWSAWRQVSSLVNQCQNETGNCDSSRLDDRRFSAVVDPATHIIHVAFIARDLSVANTGGAFLNYFTIAPPYNAGSKSTDVTIYAGETDGVQLAIDTRTAPARLAVYYTENNDIGAGQNYVIKGLSTTVGSPWPAASTATIVSSSTRERWYPGLAQNIEAVTVPLINLERRQRVCVSGPNIGTACANDTQCGVGGVCGATSYNLIERIVTP